MAPQPEGWSLENGRLLVLEGAQFPMVDISNGRSEDRMILRNFRIHYRPLWHVAVMWLLALCIIAGLFQENLPRAMRGAFEFLTLGGVLGMVILLLLESRMGGVNVRVFCSRQTDGLILISNGLGSLLTFGVLGFIFSDALRMIAEWLPYLAYALIGIYLVARIVIRFLLKKPSCRSRSGEHFEIRGLHPDALDYLRKHPCGGGGSDISA